MFSIIGVLVGGFILASCFEAWIIDPILEFLSLKESSVAKFILWIPSFVFLTVVTIMFFVPQKDQEDIFEMIFKLLDYIEQKLK